MEFYEKVSGKWILAGEHAVLRGQPALVFPVHNRHLEFSCEDLTPEFEVSFEGQNAKEYNLLFWGLVEEALKKLNRSRSELKGLLKINSKLPIGTGLGASAALCVGVAKYFEKLGWVHQEGLYEFARSLEDLFHGESSGVDIAVALEGKPLEFVRGGSRTPLSVGWQPIWTISYCGQRGPTADCVKQVQSFISENPKVGEELDSQMGGAVKQAESALVTDDPVAGFDQLKMALKRAGDCFQRWGLVSDALKQHMNQLAGAGAIVSKPTGSGGGGFVLSLWQKEPPTKVGDQDLVRLGPF